MARLLEAAFPGKHRGFDARVTFEDVKALLRSRLVEQVQSGRYYVALSLREAETLRGALHARRLARGAGGDTVARADPERPLLEVANAALALRIFTGQGGTAVLDASAGYTPARAHQQATAEQCWRFVDSDLWYTERELRVLLQAVQPNSCRERRMWFDDVLSLIHI